MIENADMLEIQSWRGNILVVKLAGTFRSLSLCNFAYNALYKTVKSKVICNSRRSVPNASTEVLNITTK